MARPSSGRRSSGERLDGLSRRLSSSGAQSILPSSAIDLNARKVNLMRYRRPVEQVLSSRRVSHNLSPLSLSDPKTFTQAWKMALTWDRSASPEREWEDACYEGAERTARNILEAGQRATALGIKGVHKHDELNVESSYAPARLLDSDVPTPSWSEPESPSSPRR